MIGLKQVVAVAIALVLGPAAIAFILPMSRFETLILVSPDIMLVRCTMTTPDDTPGSNSGMRTHAVEVLQALKGSAKPGSTQLLSKYWPRQGERLLVFGSQHGNRMYQADEVVPVSRSFKTESLDHKELKEQVRMLLLDRIATLSLDLDKERDERMKLEEEFSHTLPPSGEILRLKFQEALEAGDTNALFSLFNWDGVPDWKKASQCRLAGQLVASELAYGFGRVEVRLLPLPGVYDGVRVHRGMRVKPNVTVLGLLDAQVTVLTKTGPSTEGIQFYYGEKTNVFYIAAYAEEKIERPK